MSGDLTVEALSLHGLEWMKVEPVLLTHAEAACDPVAGPPLRSRPVRRTRLPCTAPTLAITASPKVACPGQSVTVSWQASDPLARVCIGGVGDDLPASGSRSVVLEGATVLTGRARSCAVGPASSASVAAVTGATASIAASPSTIRPSGVSQLTIKVGNASSWRISSTTGADILPNDGNTSGTFTATYRLNDQLGDDVLTLFATGACGTVSAYTTVTICPSPAEIFTFNNTSTAIEKGDTVRLDFTLRGALSWTLTSAIGNLFTVPSGSGDSPISSQYFADTVGSDVIRLEIVGACGVVVRELPVYVCETSPNISLSVTPARIKLGQRAQVTLNCNGCSAWNADSGGAGLLDPRTGQGSGPFTLSILANEGLGTFSLSAQGVNACGSGSAHTTLIVE